MSNKHLEVREEIRHIVEKTLRGPLFGEEEVMEKSPRDFYLTGIIYPQTTNEVDFDVISAGDKDTPPEDSDTSPDVESGAEAGDQSSEEEFDELVMTTDFKPSAFGISVMTDLVADFQIDALAGFYTESIRSDRKDELDELIEDGSINPKYIPSEFKQYTRSQAGIKGYEISVSKEGIKLFADNGEQITSDERIIKEKIHENLSLHITKRDLTKKRIEKNIVTLTLVNELTVDDQRELYDPQRSYFQPEIKAYSNKPTFTSFDDYTDLTKIQDQEELNLKLLYKDYQSYGTGHGAAVSWEDPNHKLQKTRKVESQIIPLYEVKGNDFEPHELIKRDEKGNLEEDCEILYMKRLAGEDFHGDDEDPVKKKDLIRELREFSDTYGEWIEEQKGDIEPSIDKLNLRQEYKDELVDQAEKNLDICQYLKSRMDKGISLIDKNDLVYRAFSDANKAMFMQRAMNTFTKARKKKYGDKIIPGDTDESLPDFKQDYDFKPEGNEKLAKWRPFQLAFLLSQIEGMVNPDSEDRETVDLIWFTTGGGKTEAYLGLIAFTIFFRRLREGKNNGDPDLGAGVTSIMRYTLRLLNKQQFNRAAPLICSCELIRRSNTEIYGNEEISLGIWVGQSLTPNSWKSFVKSLKELKKNPDDKTEYSLPLFECPCCGTRLVPESRDGEWGIIGKPQRGKKLKEPLSLYCPNSKCQFHIPESARGDFDKIKQNSFPIYFVDEDIYKHRPTLLFATADKFASINWRPESFKLFNLKTGNGQSEAVNPPPELIVQDELHLINSSLGTIYGVYEIALDKFCSHNGHKPKVVSATATARNAEKQCKLLYSREKYLQFPPAGIDIDDSFFSRKVKDEEESGRYYLGLQPSGFTNTVAQIRLVGTLLQRIPAISESNEIIDQFYTVLVYFNTLRELGKFRTLNEDDIVAYRNFLSKQFKTVNTGYKEERTAELSSELDSDEINKALEKLEKAKLPEKTVDSKLKELFKLGLRQSDDIEILKKSNEWLKPYNRRGYFELRGEFPDKVNDKEVFDVLDIPFNDKGDADAIEENEKRFSERAKEILPTTNWKVANVASATSMISVGVDIPRLNVMQVTGQPKTHSEYIQASSRIGRETPGIVITTFNPAKNRDRSHYEKFTDYHQAFYKDVEPTSVTPYSLPALEKALPAVIYSLMQAFHYGGKIEGANWSKDAEKYFEEIRKYSERRITKTIKSISDFEEQELDEILANLNQVFDDVKEKWIELDRKNDGIRFSKYADYPFYSNRDYIEENVSKSLYVKSEYGDDFPNKPGCMTSIRNVESGSEIKILKEI